MTVSTVINATNVHVPAADAAQGTDFYYPSAAGVAIPTQDKSWKLTVDKTGLPVGVKYLTVGMEYQRSTGWSLDCSNEPDGWQGGVNHLDGGATSLVDYIASEIGSYDSNGNLLGEYPSHARLHVIFSSGFTSPQIQLQTATDLSLL